MCNIRSCCARDAQSVVAQHHHNGAFLYKHTFRNAFIKRIFFLLKLYKAYPVLLFTIQRIISLLLVIDSIIVQKLFKSLIIPSLVNKQNFFYYIMVIAAMISIAMISTPVHAAIIKGTIYDLGLSQESNVRIEINTVPHQIFIAKNGTYAFNVPIGNYTLDARTIDGFANETVIVDTNGEYLLDIVLEPIIDKPVIINTELDTASVTPTNFWLYIIIGVIILAILIIGSIMFLGYGKKYILHKQQKQKHQMYRTKKEHAPEHIHAQPAPIADEFGMQVLRIIKKEERITQKDLRKQIPLSEGKVSLIITHLEHEGKIKKIKKGRGNVLVFVKE